MKAVAKTKKKKKAATAEADSDTDADVDDSVSTVSDMTEMSAAITAQVLTAVRAENKELVKSFEKSLQHALGDSSSDN